MLQDAGSFSALDFDIISLVIQELKSRHAILSMMKTCKALHDYGITFMLRIPISFDQWFIDEKIEERQENLCLYLQKHPSRLKYIREVIAESSYMWDNQPDKYPYAIKAFKIMFEQCHNLTTISFAAIERYRDDERQSPRVPLRIFPVKHILHHLRSLKVANVGPDVYLMLRGLTAPLTSLSISFCTSFTGFLDDESEQYPLLVHPRYLIPLLTNFTATLEEILIFFLCLE
ncbi:hypothetical protein C8Q75DRAFT_580406 [Abortiporus biennis]|nr:hypothetical protein C8Q75DRAFT_580406 [Abortiporus biennis]